MECDEVSFFQKQSDAALLLLMLEAVPTDLVFTISLKRSTQNLQLSTSSPADYTIFRGIADMARPAAGLVPVQNGPIAVKCAAQYSRND